MLHVFSEPLRGKIMASRIDEFKKLARVFYALGNKTRFRITVLLSKGEMNVTAIQKKLKLPQSSISCHLGILREGGLVVNRREGHNIFYSIANLSKHRLGKKSELTKAKSNAAKFGPVELVLLQTAGQSNKLKEMARIFYALGDKTRLSIMMLLAEGEMNVMAVQKRLKLPQSTTSHHLNLLREGGLVVNRRDGQHVFYSLADLTKHRLGQKAELAKQKTNAAKFGPVELVIPKK
jgi:ArsR family transcriptional regulator, zinc-responsive transcriptional repressor